GVGHHQRVDDGVADVDVARPGLGDHDRRAEDVGRPRVPGGHGPLGPADGVLTRHADLVDVAVAVAFGDNVGALEAPAGPGRKLLLGIAVDQPGATGVGQDHRGQARVAGVVDHDLVGDRVTDVSLGIAGLRHLDRRPQDVG